MTIHIHWDYLQVAQKMCWVGKWSQKMGWK